MLKLDILVPIILILCLLALAYILSKVFSPAEQEVQRRTNTEIVLDEDAYRDDGDLGAPTNGTGNNSPSNVSNIPSTDNDDLEEYYQDDSEGTVNDNDNATDDSNDDEKEKVYYDDDAGLPASNASSSSSSGTATTTRRSVSSGQYMVITGSFRQKNYAQQLVRELKRDGFSDAYVGITNRGAYAVAVAGNSSSYSTAKKLEQRAESMGYNDTFVKQAK